MAKNIHHHIADIMLSTAWRRPDLETAISSHFSGVTKKRSQKLVHSALQQFGEQGRPSIFALTQYLVWQESLSTLIKEISGKNTQNLFRKTSGTFFPAIGFSHAEIPEICTIPQLASFLDLDIEALSFLASGNSTLSHRGNKNSAHYMLRLIPKASGGERLIEIPKPKLKAIQRKINEGILAKIKPHAAAQAFRRGKSCITNASIHGGEKWVLSLDFSDFFTSVTAGRVAAVYRRIGFPFEICQILTELSVVRHGEGVSSFHFSSLPRDTKMRLAHRHLAQGAPTSPALSNLISMPLDVRLTELANRFELRFTRYADDLTFSGDAPSKKVQAQLITYISEICSEFGLTLNTKKTRTAFNWQRQAVTGVVVNQHTNIQRDDYDRLKAILHNCKTRGVASANIEDRANFKTWLLGKINWLASVNPHKGQKLLHKFEELDWQS